MTFSRHPAKFATCDCLRVVGGMKTTCLFDNSKLDIYIMILAGSSISTKGRLVIARLPPVRVA